MRGRSEGWKGRVGDIVGKLPVILRLAGVEGVLVLHADHDLVDEWLSEPAELVEAALAVWLASGCPCTDNRPAFTKYRVCAG